MLLTTLPVKPLINNDSNAAPGKATLLCQSLDHFVKTEMSTGWIALKFCTDIHAPLEDTPSLLLLETWLHDENTSIPIIHSGTLCLLSKYQNAYMLN